MAKTRDAGKGLSLGDPHLGPVLAGLRGLDPLQDRSVVGGGPFGDQAVPLRWEQTTLDLFTESGHFVRTGPDPVPLDAAEKPGGCGQVTFRQSKTEGLCGDPGLDLSIEEEETVGGRS